MNHKEHVEKFYLKHIPGAKMDGALLKAPCPFCKDSPGGSPGIMVVFLNPESYFHGYFRCLNRCTPGGFPLYFGKRMDIDPTSVPGYDPDREPYARDVAFPTRNLKKEMDGFISMLKEEQLAYFSDFGVPEAVVREMGIGYNGRYLVYPYVLENGHCYTARCLLPERDDDNFWHGNEDFTAGEFRTFNVRDIDRCEGGSIFITDGELELLMLKAMGYPGIATPSAADFKYLESERLSFVNNIFLSVDNTPEAHASARELATRLGFKVRMLKWPVRQKRGYNLRRLALDKGKGYRSVVSSMIRNAKAFSPFSSPEKEHGRVIEMLNDEKGKTLLGFETGLRKMDRALNGVRGINIMGGPPKAGKSCFFMQISTEMARRKAPVIYYDFENGRQKIYRRTLSRITRLSDERMRSADPDPEAREKLEAGLAELEALFHYFRVVTDRKLTPDIMRRQIDFLQHETRTNRALVVVDSLHKLPFKSLTERRTGIDSWLRNLEAIRDEQNVSFLVISELSRSIGGSYSDTPDLGSFKESGDIEYSADNAMLLLPDWDLTDPISTESRKSTLWMAASRENSPGKVADYLLDYPYWGFKEM